MFNLLDPSQQGEIRIETENRLPDFWKENLIREELKVKLQKCSRLSWKKRGEKL